MILLPVLAMLAPLQEGSANNAEPDRLALSKLVAQIAFDPSRYSDQPLADLVRIAYRGDDYGWPVFAIAVSRTCAPNGEGAGPCIPHTTARMVRGARPAGTSPERPRWRGLGLVNALAGKGQTSPSAIGAALERGRPNGSKLI